MAKHARSPSGDDDGSKKVANKKAKVPTKDPMLKHPTIERAKEIDADPPFDQLVTLLDNQKTDHPVRNVLHWFRSKDLRQEDNRALHAASQKAREGKGALLTMYLYSPRDMEWHGTSPARSDFINESLDIVRKQLHEKNIPLTIVEAHERAQKTDVVLKFIRDNDISHVFGNFEYEVDELRRDIKVVKHVAKEENVSFEILHDQTVVEPGTIKSGSGGPMKVFTPYHKAWLATVANDPSLFDLVPSPEANDKSVATKHKKLFEGKLPQLPENKQFENDEEKQRLRKLWPPGHEAGMKRLEEFLTKKVTPHFQIHPTHIHQNTNHTLTQVANYAETRTNPGLDTTSRLSPYFSAGLISIREALQAARSHSKSKKSFDAGTTGIGAWVRELVFREFYRQSTVILPHGNMNLPQNLNFQKVEWEDDEEGWRKWCEGKTGEPLIDAGMRQLKTEAWMHNRARMNVGSYLSRNLLLDYRRGERWFATHLIDWDLSNNTQGWEPSYTVFNPVSQAERNDPEGEYIRRWVPELRDVEGKAVFAPHARLSKEEFEKLGYPKPHVDWKESKQRCLERYKRDLHS